MVKEDGSKAFLLSLKRQEEAERLANPTRYKLNVTEEAIRFVEKSDGSLDEVNVDLHSPGFFDELFFDELAKGDAHRLKKAALDDSELNVIDDQYFGESIKNATSNLHPPNISAETHSKSNSINENSDPLNVIDDQYFGNVVDQKTVDDAKSRLIKTSSNETDTATALNRGTAEDFSDIDVQYFGVNNQSDAFVHGSQIKSTQLEHTRDQINVQEWQKQTSHNRNTLRTGTESALDPVVSENKDGFEVNSDSSKDESFAASNEPYQSRVDEGGIRKAGKRKSFGVNTLKAYLPNFDDEPAYRVVETLVDSVIFHDDKIVCINKPYSLHSQGGPGVHHSVHKYLPEIAKNLGYDGTLHLCHRLDRDVSGVLMLAKGEEQSVRMKKRFESRDIEKKYLALTFGVPKPMSGVIDIPIATESIVNGNYRSILLPVTTKTRRRGVYLAETAYKVLKYNDTAALLELKPLTGRKHQLRVHLADGLGTPILGDHKYSHRDRLAPQRLTKDILAKFHIEQSQVRNMPMHLHAHKLVLPNYFPAGKELTLSTKLPEFFRKSIKLLKFFR